MNRRLLLLLPAALLTLAASPQLQLRDVPVPRAGQWELTSDEEGGGMKTRRQCEDGKPIEAVDRGPDCAAPVITHSPEGEWKAVTRCASKQMNSRLTISGKGDFDKAITSVVTFVYTLRGGPTKTSVVHAAYRYLGPCPAEPAP